jgi:anion-transporting  ArsA/GET3 family ATPase
MENQHRKVTGYRELDAAEIDLMNAIKRQGEATRLMVEAISASPNIDGRALAIAKTELQTGFMWLTRAVARPESF